MLLSVIAEMLILAGQTLRQEFEKDSRPTQLPRAERVLNGFCVALQYARDVCALENCHTMPITNSRAARTRSYTIPRARGDRAASKVGWFLQMVIQYSWTLFRNEVDDVQVIFVST